MVFRASKISFHDPIPCRADALVPHLVGSLADAPRVSFNVCFNVCFLTPTMEASLRMVASARLFFATHADRALFLGSGSRGAGSASDDAPRAERGLSVSSTSRPYNSSCAGKGFFFHFCPRSKKCQHARTTSEKRRELVPGVMPLELVSLARKDFRLKVVMVSGCAWSTRRMAASTSGTGRMTPRIGGCPGESSAAGACSLPASTWLSGRAWRRRWA